jgi:xanthine dehydrogenase YagS FAD-binding subunit
MRPSVVVDINPLASAWSAVNADGENLRLGALARMSDVAAHPQVQRDYPMVADALKFAASPQLRHMASLGGNVLQRTR